MECKPIFRSKVFWFNICYGVLAVVQALQGEPWFAPQWQAVIVAVVNVALRFLTDQPVTMTGRKCPPLTLLLAFALSGALGLSACAGLNANTHPFDPSAQLAGLDYLQASLASVQASAEQVKLAHPELAGRVVAEVDPVLASLGRAVDGYRAALMAGTGAPTAWSQAQVILTSVLQVLAPILIQAVLTGQVCL